MGERGPKSIIFSPTITGHQEIPSTMDKPRKSDIQIISKCRDKEQKKQLQSGKEITLGSWKQEGGMGMGLAFFIMSLLVCFDFLIMCMYYINKSKNLKK